MRQFRTLLTLLLLYGTASLVHFVHNAEFAGDYPGFPAAWSRTVVYAAWLGLTSVGLLGWYLLSRGLMLPGLLVLAAYAAGGLDSLGHYVLAPLSAHTLAMNSTILLEVTCAGLVLAEVARQAARRLFRPALSSSRPGDDR